MRRLSRSSLSKDYHITEQLIKNEAATERIIVRSCTFNPAQAQEEHCEEGACRLSG
jgi:hypothetical protein